MPIFLFLIYWIFFRQKAIDGINRDLRNLNPDLRDENYDPENPAPYLDGAIDSYSWYQSVTDSVSDWWQGED